MLPSGRDNASRSSYSEQQQQQRPISDKEEIARAALRSLASPSATSTPSDPQLLPPPPSLAPSSYPPAPSTTAQFPCPHPSQYCSSRELPHHSLEEEYRTASYDRREPASLRETGMTRDSSSLSSFHEQPITASPESSPILAAAPTLPPPPPPQMYARHSIPSTSASSDIHEVAIRRASVALGVDVEEVRHIVHNTYLSHRTSSTSSSAASAAASSQGYLPPSSAAEHESPFVRQVLDAYSLESDRASHASHPHPHPPSHSDYDYDARPNDPAPVSSSSYSDYTAAAAEPSGMTRYDAGLSTYRASQYQAPLYPHAADRAPPQISWGSTATTRALNHDAGYLHHGTFRPAYPTYQDTRRPEAPTSSTSASTSTAPLPQQREESPSPFAYDAYRRTSHHVPPPQESSYAALPASSSRMASRASQDYLDELTCSRAIDKERRFNPRSRYPVSAYAQQHPHVPPSSLYERKGRSIDDYLEQQQQQLQQQQQQQQQSQLPHRRRGSIAYYPGRTTTTVAEHEDDRLPDRHIQSTNRHSFQPYPSTGSRYAIGSSSAASASSPQLSPTMPESPRSQQFSQLRSPAPRSPAAETVASVASSSVTSVASMTPSPLLGAVGGSSSANLTPDDREHEPKPSPGVESDRSSSLHSGSVDTAAESTRAGVAKMQIDDDGSSSKATRGASRKPGSSRSSFSHADRGSALVAGTDLSHSEIMQRLQDKVKSRLAAKGKAAASAAGSTSTGKNGKPTSSAGSDSRSRIARLARGNSNKRSASSITKSESPSRASGASPTPSGSRVGESKSSASNNDIMEAPTAEKSASPMGGVPAPKVRRTSASSQQKPTPAPKPSPKSPPSKTASLASTAKSTETPTSIAAALLSPTDTPTPSEAAATHAQRISRSPLSPAEGVVESVSGQALPADIPGAGQMNAASATKQQTSKSGIDSLIQAAQASDPTETNSAIA
ncbi:uncharacterized protein UHOD_03205 [Ustilago sp. UG-2017b]|nr:uncharacterized protein UHOD_03205 [Ustilago sp. UG-2017b]